MVHRFCARTRIAYSLCRPLQAHSSELKEHEGRLEAWKRDFMASAKQKIGEREAGLEDWSARLEARGRELEENARLSQVRRVPQMSRLKHAAACVSRKTLRVRLRWHKQVGSHSCACQRPFSILAAVR